jgi:cbb3-type cytochrome oxidase maturation protein
MEIIYITIPVTLFFIAIALGIFFWASRNGQFDDIESPAHRILFDEEDTPSHNASTNEPLKNQQQKNQHD